MTWKEYLKESARTSAEDSLEHAVIGVGTEAGELLDAYKKHRFYAAPLDRCNLAEEIGDLLWYLAMIGRMFDLDIHEIMKTNIAKLRARYPDDFNPDKAENRDLLAERRVLEGEVL